MLIDQAGLNQLKSEIGDEMVVELLGSFLEKTDSQIASVKEAAGAGDLKQLERVTHSLKGSSSSLALLSVSEAAKVVVEACRQEQADQALAGVPPLVDLLEQTRIAIQQEIGA